MISRRVVVRSTIFGLLGASIPDIGFAKSIAIAPAQKGDGDGAGGAAVDPRYPAVHEPVVAEVVGVSHSNLDRLRELVDPRPELARATWDWGFGDWETAIGAASHVGRRDIAEYLIGKGARPDLFTFAMFGAYDTVRSMIEVSPGLQRIAGPHGISLLQHVKNGLRSNSNDSAGAAKLQAWLESLGDADGKTYDALPEVDMEVYVGDYRYGEGEGDGFSVRVNSRKMLSLGKIGKFGGALNKIGERRFLYNGITSVEISFQVLDGSVASLTVHEPALTLTAKKIQ